MALIKVGIGLDKAKADALANEVRGIKDGFGRVLAPAINKTVATGKTRLKRRMAGILALRAKTIGERITSGRKATKMVLKSNIRLSDRRIELAEFSPRQKKEGVSVKVFKSEGRETLPHFFINKGLSTGKKHVFDRETVGGKRVPRTPHWIKYGYSIASVYENWAGGGEAEEALKEIGDTFEKNVLSQTDRILNRRKSF